MNQDVGSRAPGASLRRSSVERQCPCEVCSLTAPCPPLQDSTPGGLTPLCLAGPRKGGDSLPPPGMAGLYPLGSATSTCWRNGGSRDTGGATLPTPTGPSQHQETGAAQGVPGPIREGRLALVPSGLARAALWAGPGLDQVAPSSAHSIGCPSARRGGQGGAGGQAVGPSTHPLAGSHTFGPQGESRQVGARPPAPGGRRGRPAPRSLPAPCLGFSPGPWNESCLPGAADGWSLRG